MKKFIAMILMMAGISIPVFAISGTQVLVNTAGQSYSSTPTQNLLNFGTGGGTASNLSVQVTYSSASIPAQTFIGGQESTATITVVSTSALISAQATDTLTVPSTALILGAPATGYFTVVSTIGLTGQAVTINIGSQALIFTYGGNWTSTDTVNHAAATLAGAMNGVAGIIASASSAVVSATSAVNGTFANSWTMATSSSPLVSVSSANFSGGLNRALLDAYFSINGINYKNGYHWSDVSNLSTGTAASIAAFINGISTANATCGQGVGNLTAVASSSLVTFTQAIGCSAGNTMTLAGSTGAGFTFGSPIFTGGQNNASFSIGGVTFQYPTQWTLGASSTTSTTATSIAAAINANAITSAVMSAAATSNVVHATGTITGISTNYSLASSTVALGVIGFTGGLNTAFSSGSTNITLPTNGFTTDLPVVFNSAGTVSPLSNGTTYFVIVVDANNIKLASSSSNALAGTAITLSSVDATTTAHTATLTPTALTLGSAGGLWQVSNDGTNWATYANTALSVAVASQTFTSAQAIVVQDFGPINYNYLRYNITGPTQGAVALKVVLTSKD